jgi:hypothetical protein
MMIAMRRWIFIVLWLLIPMVARANPCILNPSSLIAFGVVALWALIVEAGIVALLLTFVGLAPLRIFGGYFIANVAVFLFVFWPLQQHVALPLLEAGVVLIDAASILILSRFTAFQGDSFRRVVWWYAGLTSLAGNAASFCIGVIASGSPWEMHGAGE